MRIALALLVLGALVACTDPNLSLTPSAQTIQVQTSATPETEATDSPNVDPSTDPSASPSASPEATASPEVP